MHRYFSMMILLQEDKFRPNVSRIVLAAVTSVRIALVGSPMVIGNEEEKRRVEKGSF
jgi:hypothetical protein